MRKLYGRRRLRRISDENEAETDVQKEANDQALGGARAHAR